MTGRDSGECILVIEGDPLSLKLYRDLVQSRGYGVLTAIDSETGLDLAREHRPDLIIADAKPPERSGIEVCRALKSDARTGDIPILLLTVWPQLERAARAAGCDRFLIKPVPISTLWREVEALIGRVAAR